ncbi:hypothetical protein AJ85_06320 [Alkalihalobacillus alcalophilus ATCC 27647 = CGMCC 1.3604]|uniref:Uncharacterized protein n=1 Tax=Alkalihalobacillus alcalophilus ATCC 27647 = CGMCC 1.3604 TaxID=1218173 RepID=A0A4S4K0T7_ALKAL|nr:hypothetical protein AJ85_06320 [Alkalihalobacillus alcalophilus ATCC 27647 = CGMCC 1.3604]
MMNGDILSINKQVYLMLKIQTKAAEYGLTLIKKKPLGRPRL